MNNNAPPPTPPPFELLAQLELLERRVNDLESRLDRWAQNGLDILDHARLFPGSGGLYGTDPYPARLDHGHTE